MKKKILVGLLMSVLAAPAWSAGLNIAVINMQKLLTQAPQVEAINLKLKQRFSGPKDDLDKMAGEIQKLEKEIKRNELMMTASKLKKSKENLMSQVKKFRTKEAQLSQELKTVQQQELSVFKGVIGGVLKNVAAKGNYDLILNDGVIFSKPALDITDKILSRLKALKDKK